MINISRKWMWFFLVFLMSAYILYEHATHCHAIDPDVQIVRHRRLIAGNSEFYNPWQYRVFTPMVLEGCIWVYNRVLSAKPEIMPYLSLHFVQIVFIFYISIYYYHKLGLENPYLIATGLLILCYSMANSIFRSDLSFNTYFDIIFYLAAAIFILDKRYTWLIPLTVVAALNRETSGFIPLMLLFPVSLRNLRTISHRKLVIAGLSLVLFTLVFVLVRWYFGYRPAVGIHGMSTPSEFLVFNLTFLRLYPLLIGTLGIVPLMVVFGLRKLPPVLRSWFWLIVPAWFTVHFLMSTAVETRLFLVPQALIFIPAFLWLIEKGHEDRPVVARP